MTEVRHRDPLLTITQFLLRVVTGLIALTAVVVALAIVALILFPHQQLVPRLSADNTLWWVVTAAMVSLVLLTLYLSFTLTLSRIVATVGTGDPFQPENADRLDRMAWLTLAMQGCLLVLAPMVGVIASRIDGLRGDFDVSPDGFILALVLFILARVFRRGTQMRDDLEGTV
ncbi:DUF2975 domain-containing protein [Sphingomonas sp. MS122]|uniref:DUF2975 domain-containing protein n=1 Tax=Sphingomonas sp. MS122 TaxID=3412683 RepID=UPI003C2FBD2B